MTFARLVMAIVASELIVREKQSGMVILLIIAIIIFDIADGAVYRKSGKPDTGFRRALDSVTDKVSMFSVAISALVTVYPPPSNNTCYSRRTWHFSHKYNCLETRNND